MDLSLFSFRLVLRDVSLCFLIKPFTEPYDDDPLNRSRHFFQVIPFLLLVFISFQPVIYLDDERSGSLKGSAIRFGPRKFHLDREKQLRRLASCSAHAAADYQKLNGAENSFRQDFLHSFQCEKLFSNFQMCS